MRRRHPRVPPPTRNVRLLVCCDEETGGEGGVEALKEHDARLPPRDPARFIDGDVALIPDKEPPYRDRPAPVGSSSWTPRSRLPVSLSAVVAYRKGPGSVA